MIESTPMAHSSEIEGGRLDGFNPRTTAAEIKSMFDLAESKNIPGGSDPDRWNLYRYNGSLSFVKQSI